MTAEILTRTDEIGLRRTTACWRRPACRPTQASCRKRLSWVHPFRLRRCVPGTATDVAPGGNGGNGGVQATIGTLYEIEQRTVRIPAGVADWIAELLREEAQVLEEVGHRAADRDQDDDQGVAVEPAWW
ncbi:hypothetical protein P3T27_006668 [Kitasatospora sp. MAA19]|uniref:hypothetical protein n=1 Tax=Kitasatospora sp. MAA19 TaxID=3035090 RepID=UPI0024733F09|nr:hypothetical protein [Kitasatospora sp. MAA19]MDH6709919.1 hypothetical protein [Kitasatospora sp. MAA19]